ncbi:MAG: FAD-binding oxidoreductase [Bacteroidota bacterium]|nr:FAD-binding oxidoreductase [Bacteroidota bacterium]MDX5430271.1 FAD-binding oxidoreductase [Bacteroidota bacterium]MDX5469032.1 FAD-binding oxidoreductase [Bacteroidota bacterium]
MTDVLIIGQGIAGSVLARHLEKKGFCFHIVEGKVHPSASRVAAGVWNPIAVKRFSKTWLADETIPKAKAFFKEEAEDFGQSFFFQKPLLKVLSNEKERNQMLQAWEGMQPFVQEDSREEVAPGVPTPFGILKVHEAGFSDVPGYLDACKRHWEKNGQYREETFQHDALHFEDGYWNWKGEQYKQVVFCEGISGKNNPWMKDLPLGSTKGQVLELEIENLPLDGILNKQIFVLPQADGRFRVGSTYEWNAEDLNPTEAGRQELMQKLKSLLPEKKMEVTRQEAGARPTTKDRRPLIGSLSEPGLYVFNGLGSRGVLLVPYLAECMCRYLEGEDAALPSEARLERLRK